MYIVSILLSFCHISLCPLCSIPPIPASIIVLVFVFLVLKKRFQAEFWSDVQRFFRIRSEDIKEEAWGRSSGASGDPLQSTAANLAGKRFFLVAELCGRVVGTLAVRESSAVDVDSGTCRLYWMCTHPACRRIGIASKLVKEALRMAKCGGYTVIIATANKSCTNATAALEKVGFEKHSEIVFASAYPMSFSVNQYKMQLS